MLQARLKVSNTSKPTPTAPTPAKPNSATTPSTPAAKTSRRLLGLLAVNGQIEDTVGTIFAETFTAERKSIPHPDLARIPADEEIVDLGVFGSGNSEVCRSVRAFHVHLHISAHAVCVCTRVRTSDN